MLHGVYVESQDRHDGTINCYEATRGGHQFYVSYYSTYQLFHTIYFHFFEFFDNEKPVLCKLATVHGY